MTPQEVVVAFDRGDTRTPAILGSIYEPMHLGVGGEDVAAWPAMHDLTIRANSLFSFATLSRLSLLYEGQTPQGRGVGNSLAAKLHQASSAEQRGSPRTRDVLLNAYINELRAQRGVTLTDAQISTLTTLALTLR